MVGADGDGLAVGDVGGGVGEAVGSSPACVGSDCVVLPVRVGVLLGVLVVPLEAEAAVLPSLEVDCGPVDFLDVVGARSEPPGPAAGFASSLVDAAALADLRLSQRDRTELPADDADLEIAEPTLAAP